MEETIGKYWHDLITFAARSHYPESAVLLDDVKSKLGIWFRALGGQNVLRIDAAIPRQLGQERTRLQRIAGTNKAVPVASLEHDCLRLPGELAAFSDKVLNKELYYWLSALAANNTIQSDHDDWLSQNIKAVRNVLTNYPGLRQRYYELVDAYIKEQKKYKLSNEQEKKCFLIIQKALKHPFLNHNWPEEITVRQSVPLWLYPAINKTENNFISNDETDTSPSNSKEKKLKKKDGRKGEYRNMPKREDGLLATRLESLFSWSEYVGVDRPIDEGNDDEAERVADDLDIITLSRDKKSTSSRLKFDLDLPSEQEDQVYLGEGVLQEEWDYKKQIMQPDYCSVQTMVLKNARPTELPKHLYYKSRKIKAQFERLLLSRVWHNAQNEGDELDIEAIVQLTTDMASGHSHSTANLYRRKEHSLRDLCCLLLADISFSTDAYINDETRIIDCIQDSLYLFSEALSLTGDRFAINAFSSKRRNHVRLSWIKHFDEPLNSIIRGRISDLSPGYYTRIGAAIRYATTQLAAQAQEHKLLLILTDGKPNDLDRYEGRYGIEDTRKAIIEAKQKGIHPFCVSIDDKANDYLPYIFGRSSYVFVRNADELPYKLPKLYLKLTS